MSTFDKIMSLTILGASVFFLYIGDFERAKYGVLVAIFITNYSMATEDNNDGE